MSSGRKGTIAPTPQPSPETPGFTGWKSYEGAVYGYTISYPDDWSVNNRASERWRSETADLEDPPWDDVFLNPPVDGDEIGLFVFQLPAPAGADLSSWDGFVDAVTALCAEDDDHFHCVGDRVVTRMCLGSEACQPVALVKDMPRAFLGDPETDNITFIGIGRVDNFPAAARYGGTEMLLKSILDQLGVREPAPGETPN